MTDRNLEKELNYYVYNDPEYGEDIENIDYKSLIGLLGELLDRVEKLETSLKATQRYISGSYE
jgi:hypothetical protein